MLNVCDILIMLNLIYYFVDLPHRRGTSFSMHSHLPSRQVTRDDDKVQWIDALNRWVAENKVRVEIYQSQCSSLIVHLLRKYYGNNFIQSHTNSPSKATPFLFVGLCYQPI